MENPVTEAAMSPLQNFVLPTLDVPIDFDGWLAGRLDNGGGDRLRWAVLELYRWQPADGGPLGYILYTIGHSLVYHTLDSGCGKGVITAVRDIRDVTPEPYDELTACPDCLPYDLDDYDGGDQVEMERVWYKHAECRATAKTTAAEELLLALRKEPKCKNCFHRPHEGRRCVQMSACQCAEFEEASRPVSSPGVRLLAQVKGQLPDVMEAMQGKKTRL